MDLLLNIDLKKLDEPITYRHHLLLMGSCFTEHIGNALEELKFSVLQNPHGILFDPVSVCRSLLSYVQPRYYTESDLFLENEIWQSWEHHSRFSGKEPAACLELINRSQESAHDFLKKTDWIIITLGSAFSYQLKQEGKSVFGVANCHRAPAQWFEKRLVEIPEITSALADCCSTLRHFNPKLNFLFTVSPVRHIRDGVVENNRSKARLIESVHEIVRRFTHAHYFPAYELMIDVLRDYRFYDIDLVHPNYMGTEYVMERFTESCIGEETQQIMREVRQIITARKHRPFQPDTHAHRQFMEVHLQKAIALRDRHAFLNMETEIKHFTNSIPPPESRVSK